MPRTSSQSANTWTRYFIATIFCFSLLTLASPAQAHRVLVFAFAEGDTIHTESKFVGSGAVQKSQVLVQDKKTGQTLLTGTTDDLGKFSFKIPPEAVAGKLDLLIVTEATMGHKGEWLLKAESYLAGGKSATAAPPAGVAAPASTAPSTQPPAVTGAKVASFDQQALEVAMDKSLERHLAPLKEMLTDLTIHRTTLTDIIGGLGYIAGIFGLIAYFMSKKQPKT